jgi:stearoyl-CoA desaturase (Delta-9 desaturase)
VNLSTRPDGPKRRYDVLSVFTGTGLAALIAVPWYGLTHGYSPWLWLAFLVFVLWNGLSITAGYHRLWSHKSYRAHYLVRLVFALGGALAMQNSIKAWCSNHRNHHRYVDDIDRDPYSARRGFWFAHIAWMLRDYDAAEMDESNIRDLMKDPIVRMQHDHYWFLVFMLNVCLPLILGWLAGDMIAGLLLPGCLRLVVCHHTTFLINSLAHFWGEQPYSDENSSRDNPFVALLTFGEGYHNFHHTFQWDYRNGLRWYQFDPTKWLIRLLSTVNLAHGLKRTAPEKIERCIVQMQLQRATSSILNIRRINTEALLANLEEEYENLLASLNAWASCRQQWLEVKKADMAKRWDETELRLKLRELEASLELQRYRWQTMTAQFS